MKQLLGLIIFLVIGLLTLGGGCGFASYKSLNNILDHKLNTASVQYELFSWCTQGLPIIDQMSLILDHKNFVVLLQNNMELRPSGGFLGSYADIKTDSQGVAEINIQDIYVPDGQLVGHVDPPLPIQQAFGQGWWKLRDSNWDPDFKISSEYISWFFDQGGVKVDGLVGINLSLITKVLAIVGPIKPLDYPETVTSENIFELAEKYSDHDSFPGSTQKKDFLGAMGRALILKVKQSAPQQKLKLAKLVFSELKNQQILLWFKDSRLQKVAESRHWDGDLNNLQGNFLYIVETNLGANKANCCVTRGVIQEINNDQNRLVITWKNDSQFDNPVKPVFWGGTYTDYVRLIIPVGAKINSVVVDGRSLQNQELTNKYGIEPDRYQIEGREKYQIIGFWAQVKAQKTLTATIDYQLAPSSSITIHRQPGIESFDYKLSANNKNIFSGKISQNTTIEIDN